MGRGNESPHDVMRRMKLLWLCNLWDLIFRPRVCINSAQFTRTKSLTEDKGTGLWMKPTSTLLKHIFTILPQSLASQYPFYSSFKERRKFHSFEARSIAAGTGSSGVVRHVMVICHGPRFLHIPEKSLCTNLPLVTQGHENASMKFLA